MYKKVDPFKFDSYFSGVKVWNEIDDEIKKFKPLKFEAEVKKILTAQIQGMIVKTNKTKLKITIILEQEYFCE